ncbi:MAG: TonB-dependent receptor [Prolixibacteraceae bacterium]|jgi:TonB-linked SusC/RagA family outer membrane protein|nr:TonB-dependent receptor [Prolixibacteraceae bacterium]MBT6766943.1 TonB-dependent receptor [Prolixibacteraceae bacterium]MBT6998807.1 TonB-dependent receptor [Prolixibacteraceae bacterium]MBT7396685.1 TonB-dependent receptor [Prolixibacteraceae bacterium]
MKKSHQIFLRKLSLLIAAIFMVTAVWAQEKTITGAVTDESGQPLPGVTVIIEGTVTGAVTNIDGNYSLSVPADAANLAFSFVGMKTVIVPIENKTVIDLVMEAETIGLEEIVTVGYGTQKKVNLTGSVTSVQAEDLVKAPVANVSEILNGRSPGLFTKTPDAVPGADGTTLSIRGFGSPLVLVDGIEMSFNRLDPNDIESISVLKDAAAAIYGSRAGNGVILVTTKRGKTGKPTINYHGNVSFQQPTRLPQWVDSWEFAELMREGEFNRELPYTWTEDDIQKFKDGTDPNYPNQDWYGALFVEWAQMQQHNMTMRGGSEKVKYFMSLGMQDQASLFASGDWDFKRYNARANVDAQITDDLSIQFDMSYRMEIRDEPTADLGGTWTDLRTAQPVWPAELPDPQYGAYSGFSQRSPLAQMTQDISGSRYDERQYFDGKISIKYEAPWVEGLSATGAFSYRTYNEYQKVLNRPFDVMSYDNDTQIYSYKGTNGNNTLDERFRKYQKLYPSVRIDFNRTFGDHAVNAFLLGETIDTDYLQIQAGRRDLLSMDIPYLFAGSSENITNNGTASETGRASLVGRANYAFKGKYLLEGTFRYDASHKFPEDGQWGFFPSVSLGWRISEETFMEDATWLDNLKLRASFSQAGYDQGVDPFKYLTGYEIRTGTTTKYQLGNALERIITTTGLPNLVITWEQMTSYNVGVDGILWEGLLGFELDVFYRMREGIFGTPIESYPSTFGASLPQVNINSRDDRGFELTLTHHNKIGNVTYSVSPNIALAREKYVELQEDIDLEDIDDVRINQKEGQWTNRWIGYVSDGMFMSQAQIDSHPVDQDQNGNTSLRPGDIIYKDISGADGEPDGIIDWRDQDEVGYGTFPDLYYGMDVNVKWKSFSVTALFQGAGMFNMNPSNAMKFSFSNWTTPLDYHYDYRAILSEDRSTVTNPESAKLPPIDGSGAGFTANNQKTSDFYLQDNTYLRLKTLNLSYNLPKKIISSAGFQGVQVYLAGTNLLTFSGLGIFNDSFDPEGGYNYPPVKTITLGVNITL